MIVASFLYAFGLDGRLVGLTTMPQLPRQRRFAARSLELSANFRLGMARAKKPVHPQQ